MIKSILIIVFYVSFLISIFLGVYSIKLNKYSRLNQQFFLVCMSTATWSFAYTISYASLSYQEALMWRRISSLGWGVTYTLLLHFIMLLTGYNGFVKKAWRIGLLYLPSLFLVLTYGLIGSIAERQFTLVNSPLGWINATGNHSLDPFFNVYYLSYTFMCFVLLVRWYFRYHEDHHNKKNAKALLISIGMAIAVGSFTDIFANMIFGFRLPVLAPVLILIPILTCYHIIRKNKLFVREGTESIEAEYHILSENKKVKLYAFMTQVMICGGFIGVLKGVIQSDGLKEKLIFNLLIVICSAFISLVPYVFNSNKSQEYALSIMLVSSMSLLNFSLVSSSFSSTAWTLPLFFIMMTVVFSNKFMFRTIAAASVFLGIMNLWIYTKDVVHLDDTNHAFRLLVLGVGIALTSYISNVYKLRLREIEEQTDFQKMVSEVSALFIKFEMKDFDDRVNELLRTCGGFNQSDRAYIGLFSEDRQKMTISYEWKSQEANDAVTGDMEVDVSNYLWSFNRLIDDEIVFIEDVGCIPDEGFSEKHTMEQGLIKSLVLLPITTKEHIIGFLGFDLVVPDKRWSSDDFGRLRIITSILSDAFRKQKVKENMHKLAYYDPLTGLPNRAFFYDRLHETIQAARKRSENVGVVFIDLDGFKEINDTLGHNWGDLLLEKVALRLLETVGDSSIVSRFGGDEFMVMLPEVMEIQSIKAAASALVGAFTVPIELEQQFFYVTASAGIAVFPYDGKDANTLIKNADMAMYRAKAEGKNQFAWCSREMKQNVNRQMKLNNALYNAIDYNELQLLYRPLMQLETKRMIGFDTTVAWQHPELGLIQPEVFVPIAEQVGLINDFGEWMIGSVCRQFYAWQQDGMRHRKIAVSISIEQLKDEYLEETIRENLQRYHMKAENLELKIAENELRYASEPIIETLRRLKYLGVQLSVFNFGSDYSSLTRLKELPIHRLKIDQQFVMGIDVNSKDEAIVKVILHLGKTLGLKVDACGVGTKSQREFLMKEGCDEIQCVHCSVPMPLEELEVQTCYR